MKKVLLFGALALVVLAALPIVGNTYVQSNIDERVEDLKSYGLGVETTSTTSSYLNTKKHFEFLLKDADLFIEHLNNYSNQQIPAYVNAALEGVLIGADVEYSNIPFTKAISIDIYPLSVSPLLAKNMKEKDLHFYTSLEKFLHSKGVLYHINYNIVNEDFDGYIKDINEKYTLKDATELSLVLQGAVFEGQGKLIAPTRLTSEVKKIDLKMKNDQATLLMHLLDLGGSTHSESQGTYLSSVNLQSFDISVDTPRDELLLKASDLQVNLSANDQLQKAQLHTKSTLEHLEVVSKDITFEMEKLSYDVAVNGLDKMILERLKALLNKANIQPSPALNKQIIDESTQLLAKGLQLNVADLSFKKLSVNDMQNLGALEMKMDLSIKEDPNLLSKLQLSPLLLAQNIDIALKLKLSQAIYKNLTLGSKMAVANNYAKVDGDNVIFDIVFKDAKLQINGKALQ